MKARACAHEFTMGQALAKGTVFLDWMKCLVSEGVRYSVVR